MLFSHAFSFFLLTLSYILYTFFRNSIMLYPFENLHDQPLRSSTRTSVGPFSFQEYTALPEGAPFELIAGELVRLPTPVPKHQRILLKLAAQLDAYIDARGIGTVLPAPMDVHLNERNALQPDILVVLNDGLAFVGERFVQGAPDLVVEILSPSTAKYDRGVKRELYARHGSREYWLLDPQAGTLEILANRDGRFHLKQKAYPDQPLQSPLFPDFNVDLPTLFALPTGQ